MSWSVSVRLGNILVAGPYQSATKDFRVHVIILINCVFYKRCSQEFSISVKALYMFAAWKVDRLRNPKNTTGN